MAGNHNSGRKPNVRRMRVNPLTKRVRGKLKAPPDLPAEIVPIFNDLARVYGDVAGVQDVYALATWAGALWAEHTALKAMIADGLLRADSAHAGRLAKSPAFTIWKAAGELSASLAPRFGGDPAARVRLYDLLEGGEPPTDLRALLTSDDE